MTQEHTIDCQGMKCPRPIIEIAKAARKLSPGSIIIIQADDLAFESDVSAWAENTGATIVSIEKDGDRIKATLKLAE